MNNLGEVIQRVLSPYGKGVQSHDTRLSKELIYNSLCTNRGILVYQMDNKARAANSWITQVLPCAELQKASIADCPGMVIPEDCLIQRTKYKIPKPISGLDGDKIRSVSTVDGSVVFGKTTFQLWNRVSGNKYTAQKTKWFEFNGYLFLIGQKRYKAVNIMGLFEDVIAAYMFPSMCQECTDCIDVMNIDFPLDSDLTEAVIGMTIKSVGSMFGTSKEDRAGNAIDSTNFLSPQQQ